MKIEELAERHLDFIYENNPGMMVEILMKPYGIDCIRAGLKVALHLADEVQSEDGFHFDLFDERITAILEGRAELPEVEG